MGTVGSSIGTLTATFEARTGEFEKGTRAAGESLRRFRQGAEQEARATERAMDRMGNRVGVSMSTISRGVRAGVTGLALMSNQSESTAGALSRVIGAGAAGSAAGPWGALGLAAAQGFQELVQSQDRAETKAKQIADVYADMAKEARNVALAQMDHVRALEAALALAARVGGAGRSALIAKEWEKDDSGRSARVAGLTLDTKARLETLDILKDSDIRKLRDPRQRRNAEREREIERVRQDPLLTLPQRNDRLAAMETSWSVDDKNDQLDQRDAAGERSKQAAETRRKTEESINAALEHRGRVLRFEATLSKDQVRWAEDYAQIVELGLAGNTAAAGKLAEQVQHEQALARSARDAAAAEERRAAARAIDSDTKRRGEDLRATTELGRLQLRQARELADAKRVGADIAALERQQSAETARFLGEQATEAAKTRQEMADRLEIERASSVEAQRRIALEQDLRDATRSRNQDQIAFAHALLDIEKQRQAAARKDEADRRASDARAAQLTQWASGYGPMARARDEKRESRRIGRFQRHQDNLDAERMESSAYGTITEGGRDPFASDVGSYVRDLSQRRGPLADWQSAEGASLFRPGADSGFEAGGGDGGGAGALKASSEAMRATTTASKAVGDAAKEAAKSVTEATGGVTDLTGGFGQMTSAVRDLAKTTATTVASLASDVSQLTSEVRQLKEQIAAMSQLGS